MCHGCYEEYGAPTLDTPAIRRAAAAVERLYETHGAGGFMHIVTDDWNLEDEHVAFCGSVRCVEILGREMDECERECFNALEPLSIKERASALAMADY